jgi:hypothetical protein
MVLEEEIMKSLVQSTLTVLLSLMFLLITSPVSVAGQNEKEAEAIKGARGFLQLVDDGQYEASWERTSLIFKGQITQGKWAEMLSGVRPSLGEIISRNVTTAKLSTSLPGVPDGEYATVQFASSFEKKVEAIETVTMARVQKEWQVAGYFIK